MGNPYMPKAKSCEWGTPRWLFDRLHAEFDFTVDAAASAKNAKLDKYWCFGDSGLENEWAGERVFVNPPFAVRELEKWAEKAFLKSRGTAVVVMVVPVKADQAWWHKYAMHAEVRFIRGRIAFEGASSSFPGPIAVLVFGRDVKAKMVSMERY